MSPKTFLYCFISKINFQKENKMTNDQFSKKNPFVSFCCYTENNIPKTMTIFIDEKYTSVDLSDGLHHISFILCYMKIDSEIHQFLFVKCVFVLFLHTIVTATLIYQERKKNRNTSNILLIKCLYCVLNGFKIKYQIRKYFYNVQGVYFND